MKPTRVLAALAVLMGLGAVTAQAADFKIRLHTLVKSPHPYNDMAEYMKAELESKSGGRISVKIFPGASLGKDPAVIGEMGLGTIDLMISSTNNAVKQVPEYQVFSMPYLFASFDDLMATVRPDGPVKAYYDKVYADRKLGIRLLALGGSGTRNMSNAKRPVNSLADIKGMKMRTPPSPMISKTWAALGTLPVTIAWSELYAGIQTGVAEALESSIPGYKGSKLYEVAPYLALTAHTIQVNHVSIAQRTWDKLPDDLKALMTDAAIGASALGIVKAREYEDSFVADLSKNHGVTVTRPDTAEFRAVLKPVQDQLAQDMNLTEVLGLIRSSQ
ncbi:MAG: TRAP transporter substrate-binding protein [Rhodobacterales bacterium]|nr:TRAP transporter substrate-binding protein [Rhodobacterales bacterium]